MELADLAKVQADHEEMYGLHEEVLEALRHFHEHLSKMQGKVGHCLEPVRHEAKLDTSQIEDEVVGDLLYWCLQLGNQLGINPEKAYLARIAQAQTRLSSRTPSE